MQGGIFEGGCGTGFMDSKEILLIILLFRVLLAVLTTVVFQFFLLYRYAHARISKSLVETSQIFL